MQSFWSEDGNDFFGLKIYISVHRAESIKKEVLKYSMSLSGKFAILISRALVHTNENFPQDRLENMVVGNPVYHFICA